MKTLFAVGALLLSVGCFSQKNVPAAVKTSFDKSFPGVTVSKWDKEDGLYEANFKNDGKNMSATFDANGVWKETETDIAISTLPQTVKDYIQSHYNNKSIKEAAIIETPAGRQYEAEVNGKDLLFDMDGKFVKEEN